MLPLFTSASGPNPIPPKLQELPISATFTAIYAEFVKLSEKKLELEKWGRGPRSVRKLCNEADHLIKLILTKEGELVGNSPELKRIVKKQLSQYRRWKEKFLRAVGNENGKKACIASRKMRKSIELLAAIHPLLVNGEIQEAENIFRRGLQTLQDVGTVSDDYLNNIRKRLAFLEIAQEAVSESTDDGGIDECRFKELLVAKANERLERQKTVKQQLRVRRDAVQAEREKVLEEIRELEQKPEIRKFRELQGKLNTASQET